VTSLRSFIAIKIKYITLLAFKRNLLLIMIKKIFVINIKPIVSKS